MSDPRTIIEKIDKLMEAHDIDGFMTLVADDAVFWHPGGPEGREVKGAAAIRAMVEQADSAYSDMKPVVLHRYVDGDTVISEYSATSSHTGPITLSTGETVPATGRPIRERIIYVDRVVDGKIVEERMYYDRHALLQQLGQVPAAATTG